MTVPARAGADRRTLVRLWQRIDDNRLWRPLFLWACFWAGWSLEWRVGNFFTTLPGYGDALEVTWAIEWYQAHFPDSSLLFFPQIFYPEGWQVSTLAYAPGLFVFTLPFANVGGTAFAYNAVVLAGALLGYAGMYRFARHLTGSTLLAVLAALLFTFWPYRWGRLYGALNLWLGTGLMIWLVFTLYHAYRAQRRASLKWFALGGLFWALAIHCTLYFVWIGLLVIAAWAAGEWLSRRRSWRLSLSGLPLLAGIAVLLASPTLLLFWYGSRQADLTYYSLEHANYWGASLNSLTIPPVLHPQLGPLARRLYQGNYGEDGSTNLGLFASLVALLGVVVVIRQKRWRPVLLLVLVGVILALGYTVKWNGVVIETALFRPLNAAIWRVGHTFKPELFPGTDVLYPFSRAIPLPGLWFATVMPYWEGARTLSRFIFIAILGFFPVVVAGLTLFRRRHWQLLIAALLLFEIFVPTATGKPLETEGHPLYAWLGEQEGAGSAVGDFTSALGDGYLNLLISGEVLWATRLHEQATISGASSSLPAHTHFLFYWLYRERPYVDPDFIPVLQAYDVRYLLLHMQSQKEWDTKDALEQIKGLSFVQCFEASPIPSPWPYPICVWEVPQPANSQVNLIWRHGFSPPEAWGVWALDKGSYAQWIATNDEAHLLHLEAFPYCLEGQEQTLAIRLNGEPVAFHRWHDCAPWESQVELPAEQIEIGWNSLTFDYGYAVRPADLQTADSIDPRNLSVGFTKLYINSQH